MKKPTLCLIFGGKSSEYYVSLNSAYSVITALEPAYEVIKIGISKNGKWYLYKGENIKIKNDSWEKEGIVPVTIDINEGTFVFEGGKIKPYKILPILHGENYEDGKIQSLFDLAGMAYIGCRSSTSHACFDKHITKLIAKEQGIRVANDTVLFKGDPNNEKRIEQFLKNTNFPVFVKPSGAGSSVGVSKVDSLGKLSTAITLAFMHSDKVLIEEKIDGTETEIGVIEKNNEIYLSPPGQIKYSEAFYSYDAKYNQENEYIIPAKITKKTKKELEECAKKLFYALGIRGLCRMDFFVSSPGEVIFNEINTMPGFTRASMFPMLFSSTGQSHIEILNNILNI